MLKVILSIVIIAFMGERVFAQTKIPLASQKLLIAYPVGQNKNTISRYHPLRGVAKKVTNDIAQPAKIVSVHERPNLTNERTADKIFQNTLIAVPLSGNNK